MGGMDGVAYRPLTVAFHEAGFAERLNTEDAMGLPFAQESHTRQQAGSPWGPANPQALNRYAYVMGNPQKWTDETGHRPEHVSRKRTFTPKQAKAFQRKLLAQKDRYNSDLSLAAVMVGALGGLVAGAAAGPGGVAVVEMGVGSLYEGTRSAANQVFNEIDDVIATYVDVDGYNVTTISISYDSRTGIVIIEGKDSAGRYYRTIIRDVDPTVIKYIDVATQAVR